MGCAPCPSSTCGLSSCSRPVRVTRLRPMADVTLTRCLHPRYWPTWFGLGLMRLLSWMPLPLLALLGHGLGLLLYVLHAKRRHIVQVNLQLCFPDMSPRERGRLGPRHFR